MKKILVLGGCGIFGSLISRSSVTEDNHKVIITGRNGLPKGPLYPRKRPVPVHEHVQRWLNLRGFTKTRTGSLFVERYRQSLEFSERTGFFRLAHDKINQALKNVT